MLKRIFLLSAILLTALSVSAQSAQSRWRYYGAYHNVSRCIAVGDMVYGLSEGSIFSYSTTDGEVRVMDKTTGLSDADIRQMAYCAAEKCLVLVYSNSNIDVLFPADEKVSNMPQFMNSSLSDKTINDITVSGSNAYLGTNTGVTVIDLKRIEFSRTYNLGISVRSAVETNDKIWAATTKGVYYGSTSDNLLDPSAWKIYSGVFSKLRVLSGELYGLAGQVYTINVNTGRFGLASAEYPRFFSCYDGAGALYFGNKQSVWALAPGGTTTKLMGANDFTDVTASSSAQYWAAAGTRGLCPYKAGSDGLLAASGNGITLNSPVHNYCAFMNVAPSGRILVSGGSMNYNGLNYPGTLYSESNGSFTNFEDTLQTYTGLMYRNLTGAVEDPSDPGHVFASSAETGLYEFRDGRFVKHYDQTNSTLSSVLPNDAFAGYYVRTTAPQYDSQGNLWMINIETDTILKIMKRDGTWTSIYIDELAGYPTFDYLIFDDAGRAWFTHRRTTSSHNAGVACLDFGGTIDDTSDDKFRFRYRFTNEDGTTYTPNTVNAIAKDLNGGIWIGTVEGPFLIDNPDDFFATDFTFDQIKVPRNDGTDLADYLLTGVPITAIAVDKANRKWFGTQGSGLYLISADNIETIDHFTASNSPLVSDNIQSLAFDPGSGLLMIGTDKGLMSYDPGKVTADGSGFKDKDLKIYPNPVRPDFYGDVTIEGLPYGAEVKITTAGGQLVRKGVSTAGRYKWDVKDSHGAGVGSGVYYVLAVSADGKHGARGRIVVIR